MEFRERRILSSNTNDMKTLLTLSIVLFINITAMAQFGEVFKLPAAWTKDFTFELSHTGSMSGGSSRIKFTYDSVIYNVANRQKGPKIKKYLLKEKDRNEILAKLREFKVDRIKSESSMVPVHDGWSHSLCFGFHCIEGGSGAEMSETDKNLFLDASRYLEDFADKKAK